MPAGPSQKVTDDKPFDKTPSDIYILSDSMINNGDFPGFYYKIYGTYNVKNSFTTVLSTYVYFELSNTQNSVPDWTHDEYCKTISPESNYNFTSYTDLTEIRKCI